MPYPQRRRQNLLFLLILTVCIISLLFVSGCTNTSPDKDKNTLSTSSPSSNTPPASVQSLKALPLSKLAPNSNTVLNSNVERVEVYHFHPSQQCYSCKTLGNFTEETVKTFFANELSSGKLVFKHISINLPENADLVKRYEVTGSSLWIGVYNKTGFHKEQNVNVWYKINNKEEFMQYLAAVIRGRLNGVNS